MSDPSSALSIVCGTFNRRDQIERLVDSVIRETRIPFQLYITDAGSTDGTTEYLNSIRDPRVHPVLHPPGETPVRALLGGLVGGHLEGSFRWIRVCGGGEGAQPQAPAIWRVVALSRLNMLVTPIISTIEASCFSSK